MAGRRDERFETTLPLRLAQGEGVARNVSSSGIYFVTDVALETGAPVKFTLDFQNFAGGPVRVNCMARVVRVEQKGEKNGVGARINSFEFVRLAPSHKKHT